MKTEKIDFKLMNLNKKLKRLHELTLERKYLKKDILAEKKTFESLC